jgi:hypothetical protein
MASNDQFIPYMPGGARHTPRPQFSNPTTFSDMGEVNPGLVSVSETDVQGTGSLVGGVHRPSRRGGGMGTFSMPSVGSPLNLGSIGEIIENAKLGRKASKPQGNDKDDNDQSDRPSDEQPSAYPNDSDPYRVPSTGSPVANPDDYLTSTVKRYGMGRPSVVGRNLNTDPFVPAEGI